MLEGLPHVQPDTRTAVTAIQRPSSRVELSNNDTYGRLSSLKGSFSGSVLVSGSVRRSAGAFHAADCDESERHNCVRAAFLTDKHCLEGAGSTHLGELLNGEHFVTLIGQRLYHPKSRQRGRRVFVFGSSSIRLQGSLLEQLV